MHVGVGLGAYAVGAGLDDARTPISAGTLAAGTSLEKSRHATNRPLLIGYTQEFFGQ